MNILTKILDAGWFVNIYPYPNGYKAMVFKGFYSFDIEAETVSETLHNVLHEIKHGQAAKDFAPRKK